MNVVALMGRLTYEPELRSTPNGVSVMNFQIACDRQYQAKGEERQADFIDCQAWRQTAEFINRYFHKGAMIAIEGTLQTNNFTDKNGNKRKTTTVIVNNVSFCGSKQDSKPSLDISNDTYSQPAPTYAAPEHSDFEEIVDDDDDLPF